MSDVRLIDANVLSGKEEILYQHTASGKIIPCAAVRVCVINNAPTIDAAPVVNGRWDEVGKVFVHSMYDLFTKCSQCSFGHVRNEYQEPYRYCPNCGAKMDGVMG